VLKGFRAEEVVVGRVGGLFRELVEEAVPRVFEVAVLDVAIDEEVGRFVVVELDTGRLDAEVVLLVVLAGDTGAFSLDASGLDLLASSLPESTDDSTGVAGGAVSTSASTATGTGSSVDDIFIDLGNYGRRSVIAGRGTSVGAKSQKYRKGVYKEKRSINNRQTKAKTEF